MQYKRYYLFEQIGALKNDKKGELSLWVNQERNRSMYGSNRKNGGYDVHPQKWYCPNCSELLTGYQDSDGKTRAKCPQCKTQSIKYRASRRIDIIEVRIPEGYT